MAGFTDSAEQGLLDYFIATYGAATKYLALSSTTPTEAGGNFTEPTGVGSYARVATTSADWAAASGTAPATKANSAIKAFAAATADWASGGNFTHWGMFSQLAAGGTLYCWGALTVPKPVLNGDTPSFAIGALVIELGDPADTY